MTNEEMAKNLVGSKPLSSMITTADFEKVAVEMAEWKDEQLKEQRRIIRKHWQEWADEQIAKEKQKFIDKVYEFISKNFFISISNQAVSRENYRTLTELIFDFTKAMKGE